jgi:hypothetical protein
LVNNDLVAWLLINQIGLAEDDVKRLMGVLRSARLVA